MCVIYNIVVDVVEDNEIYVRFDGIRVRNLLEKKKKKTKINAIAESVKNAAFHNANLSNKALLKILEIPFSNKKIYFTFIRNGRNKFCDSH